jgi:Asp-tRNA(Asn)/Glu-tRNA(Gln) amidotransferase A subunit family amidase
MTETLSPLASLRRRYGAGEVGPSDIAAEVIGRANGNSSRNTYIHFDDDALLARAEALPRRFADPAARPPLYGVPVSLKDCFDLAGTRTSAGSRFYEALRSPAAEDSAVARRLLQAGCLITGKTHLHPLAYGITGQNREYGDCLQPADAALLTGGSSSGAAASVQEGSAVAAMGTDTGGSIRVPAALCGLVGYRASQTLTATWPDLWRGAAHLAPSFDTLGVLCGDARDLPLLAQCLFGIERALSGTTRVGVVPESFLHDAAPEVVACFRAAKRALGEAGVTLRQIDASAWEEAMEIFAPIQASEAAAMHRGYFAEFEEPIAQRLAWGARLTAGELAGLQRRREVFVARLMGWFEAVDLLMLPCAPVSRLPAGANQTDQTAARAAILRYTTPFSLGGLPTVALPGGLFGGAYGTGIQLAAAAGGDAGLLAFVTQLARESWSAAQA